MIVLYFAQNLMEDPMRRNFTRPCLRTMKVRTDRSSTSRGLLCSHLESPYSRSLMWSVFFIYKNSSLGHGDLGTLVQGQVDVLRHKCSITGISWQVSELAYLSISNLKSFSMWTTIRLNTRIAIYENLKENYKELKRT